MKELIFFEEYVRQWRQLEREYERLGRYPVIGVFLQLRNISKRQRLTKEYNKRLREWGIA